MRKATVGWISGPDYRGYTIAKPVRDEFAAVLHRRHEGFQSVYLWSDLFAAALKATRVKTIDAVIATIVMATSEKEPSHIHVIQTDQADVMMNYFLMLGRMSTRARTERLFSALPKALRPTRMPRVEMPLTHLRLGVRVHDQQTADERIPHLLMTDAWETFVHYDAPRGPFSLKYAFCSCADAKAAARSRQGGLGKVPHAAHCAFNVFEQPERRREWSFPRRVIISGDIGRRPRPFYVQWLKSVLRQCEEMNIAAYVDRVGAYPTTERYDPDATEKPARLTLSSRHGSDPAEWPPEYRVRQSPRHVDSVCTTDL